MRDNLERQLYKSDAFFLFVFLHVLDYMQYHQ